MKTIIALAFVLCAAPAYAMSVQDWRAEPEAQQSAYVVDFIEKMTADIGTSNPDMSRAIRHYFSETTNGKPFSEGIETLYVEIGALEDRAEAGRVDLSKVELESVIVWVVKRKFAPATAAK
jgi:soluble cytochrome b562